MRIDLLSFIFNNIIKYFLNKYLLLSASLVLILFLFKSIIPEFKNVEQLLITTQKMSVSLLIKSRQIRNQNIKSFM
jgi:hypothetical protein